MIDFSKVKSFKIQEGVVTKIVSAGTTLWELVAKTFTNLVPHSTETDGVTIYNAPAGCMYGYRMNSSGELREQTGANHTGYIRMTFGDVIRAKGSTYSGVGASGHYFTIYDGNFTRLATIPFYNTVSAVYYGATYTQQDDGLYMLTLDTGKAGSYALGNSQKAKFFRISMSDCKTENFVVTVNEEIV